MPELPEVETLVRALAPRLSGTVLVRVHEWTPGVFSVAPDVDRNGLDGSRILGLRRRGKLILVELDRGLLGIHLRMTGRLLVEALDSAPGRHTHVAFDLENGHEQLRYVDPRRFGRIEYHSPESLAQSRFYSTLGPEPLELDAGGFAARLGTAGAV